MTQTTRNMRKKKIHANNARRKNIDYGKKDTVYVISIIDDKNVSIKTIRQTIRTSKLFSYRLIKACDHEKAQVADILAVINEYKEIEDNALPSPQGTHSIIVNNLFSMKRKQIDIYLGKTYKVDTTQMPVSQIKDMLEIY
jgi:mevalonate pyrophosphate decarboxylase